MKENPRFNWLVEHTGQKLQELKPRGLVHVLWALVKLQHWPSHLAHGRMASPIAFEPLKGWFPELLATVEALGAQNFTARDLSRLLSIYPHCCNGGL